MKFVHIQMSKLLPINYNWTRKSLLINGRVLCNEFLAILEFLNDIILDS